MAQFKARLTGYGDAECFLSNGGKGGVSRKIAHNTFVNRLSPTTIGMVYHSTAVVVWHRDGTVQLHDGGWQTLTTKSRINEGLPLRWSLYQKKNVWYLWHAAGAGSVDGIRHEFENGMTVPGTAPETAAVA